MRSLPIMQNWKLKGIALFVAILMWLLVTNINDPIIYQPITNVPVRLANTSLITEQGQVYTVLDGTDVIPTVTIAAPRSTAEKISRDNITATANVEDITQLDTVPIRVSSNIYGTSIQSITPSIDSVRLSIEDRKEVSLTLQTQVHGTPAEGYSIGEVSMEQNQVRISGPESVVSEVQRAVATIDVEGVSSTVVTYTDIRLQNAEGEEIDTSHLTMNIDSVKTTATVLSAKIVAIRASAVGVPAVGYAATGSVQIEPSEVLLSGRQGVISAIESVSIPTEELNITGLEGPLEKEIDITDCLPDGVGFADRDFDGKVRVRVGVEAMQTRQIPLDPANVVLENVPEGQQASLVVEEGSIYTATVSGLAERLEELDVSALSPRINVGALLPEEEETDGIYVGEVQLTLPTGVSLSESARMGVEVRRVTAEETEPGVEGTEPVAESEPEANPEANPEETTPAENE